MTRLARVSVAKPLHQLFDYRIPPGSHVRVGVRVRVAFGRTTLTGVVVGLRDAADCKPGQLKDIDAVLDEHPLLGPVDLEFQLWAAAYYHHPVGEVVAAALPLVLRKGQPVQLPGTKGWRLTESGRYQLESPTRRAPRQQEILRAIAAGEDGLVSQHGLRDRFPASASALRAVRQAAWVESVTIEPRPDPLAVDMSGPPLTPAQQSAVDAVAADLDRFCVSLLDGVTGSGKTEVYLQLAAKVLRHGRSVLLLVPEISLTPQLAARFRDRLGDTVRVLHSGLGERERESVWHRARLGLSRVLLGTRSSVFTPMADLGLVIVDEEHDGSLKQTEGFRYSARDLAIVRAQRAGCPVLLGSATPSFESLRHALSGRYAHLRLDQRAAGAARPAIELLDIRDQPLLSGMAEPLLDAVARVLAAGQQVILFLNRRGFAPVLTCFSCGWISDCPHCDARQTVHRHNDMLWCHHCGAQRRVPRACPACGAADLHPLGQGTEQLEAFLGERFSEYPLIRVDRDATSRKGSLERKLQQIRETDAALLVGTQMLAKGHDWPGVTLVGVLDADGGLYSADFRATERMAQLLEQVAGRAGRGDHPGRVVIQTRFPDHPLLQALIRQGYRGFARQALLEREAAGLPPYTFQALLRADAREMARAQAFLEDVMAAIRRLPATDVALWGPVPAPMVRRAGRYRAHLLLQSSRRDRLHAILDGLPQRLSSMKSATGVRWSLDVDPVDLY